MRQTVIALRLADLIGASEPDREATYYLGLMMNSYCHADAAEQAQWFGDDISNFMVANFGPLIMLRGMLESSGAWPGLREKLEQQYDRHEPGEFLVVQGR